MSSSVVVDSSAAVAVIVRESTEADLRAALDEASHRSMAAPTFVELGMVLTGRFGAGGRDLVRDFVNDARIEVVPFDLAHAERALEGFRRYGKGRHPAGLNLGDCFTYALAIAQGDPILCVGDDFARTDAAVVHVN